MGRNSCEGKQGMIGTELEQNRINPGEETRASNKVKESSKWVLVELVVQGYKRYTRSDPPAHKVTESVKVRAGDMEM